MLSRPRLAVPKQFSRTPERVCACMSLQDAIDALDDSAGSLERRAESIAESAAASRAVLQATWVELDGSVQERLDSGTFEGVGALKAAVESWSDIIRQAIAAPTAAVRSLLDEPGGSGDAGGGGVGSCGNAVGGGGGGGSGPSDGSAEGENDPIGENSGGEGGRRPGDTLDGSRGNRPGAEPFFNDRAHQTEVAAGREVSFTCNGSGLKGDLNCVATLSPEPVERGIVGLELNTTDPPAEFAAVVSYASDGTLLDCTPIGRADMMLDDLQRSLPSKNLPAQTSAKAFYRKVVAYLASLRDAMIKAGLLDAASAAVGVMVAGPAGFVVGAVAGHAAARAAEVMTARSGSAFHRLQVDTEALNRGDAEIVVVDNDIEPQQQAILDALESTAVSSGASAEALADCRRFVESQWDESNNDSPDLPGVLALCCAAGRIQALRHSEMGIEATSPTPQGGTLR